MKIFNSKEEALKSRIKSVLINMDDTSIFTEHSKNWDFYKMDDKLDHRKLGKFFLYEKVLYKNDRSRSIKVYYPKLAIYLNEIPFDQTTEVEWVDCRRTYEWNIKYKYTQTDKDGNQREFKTYLGEIETEIQRLPLWFDELLVYGSWDSKPNWKQLRQSYERTWWFYRNKDEKRDIQLNRILG